MATDALWLTEADVAAALTLPAAIDAIDAAFAREALGDALPMTKTHVAWAGGQTLHALGAVDQSIGLVGAKTWAHTAGGATPLIQVWNADTGELRAIVEAFALGQLRTGAVSGVATRWMARHDARQFAIIGTGKQALAQVAAVTAVRDLDDVRVHSRDEEHRRRFAKLVEEEDLGPAVSVADSVAEAVDGADIITTVTRARVAFLDASALATGTHVNAVGAITPERRELQPDVFSRCGVVASDSVAAARGLAVELADVETITPLAEVVAQGDGFDRGPDLTVFKAMGVGLADLALAAVVIEGATTAGRGRSLPQPVNVAPRLKESP
jgi:ornithine cyclodeaminase